MTNQFGRGLAIGVVSLLAAMGGCRTFMMSAAQQRQDQAQVVISDWAEPARLQAAKLIEEYGPPDRVELCRLVWNNKHLWKNISGWDQLPGFGYMVEQTVSYPVPANRRSGLAAFSDAVLVSGDGTELAARSVNEDHNYLVLNLAVEIVKGIKTPAEARRFYDATLELKAAGKTSPYTEMLLFTPGTTL